MPYYAYVAPMCGYCGKEQGLVEVEGGRQRLYCSDRCRQSAKRKRDKQTKRNALLAYNTELRDYWQEQRIEGGLLTRLQDILVEHGKPAAKAATDAVLVAVLWERKLPGRIGG